MFEKRKDNADKVQEPTPVELEPKPSLNKTASRVTATIGETIHIEGQISGTENLIINGSVSGTVDLSGHDLTVGSSGKIEADLTGKTVKVDGNVNGDIKGTEVVVVSKSGEVRGNITAPRVTLEDGAKFKGSIDMDPVGHDAAEKLAHKDKAPMAPVDELKSAEG